MLGKITKELIRLSEKAAKKGEIPVSCIIVLNGKIIAKAYNQREKRNSVLAHAEILAIQKATKKLKTWHLNDCEMYVSLEPCEMCKKIIAESKIRNVYYLVYSLNTTNNMKINYSRIDEKDVKAKYKKILQKSFEKIRMTK